MAFLAFAKHIDPYCTAVLFRDGSAVFEAFSLYDPTCHWCGFAVVSKLPIERLTQATWSMGRASSPLNIATLPEQFRIARSELCVTLAR